MSYENLSPEMALVKATAADFMNAMESYYKAIQELENLMRGVSPGSGSGRRSQSSNPIAVFNYQDEENARDVKRCSYFDDLGNPICYSFRESPDDWMPLLGGELLFEGDFISAINPTRVSLQSLGDNKFYLHTFEGEFILSSEFVVSGVDAEQLMTQEEEILDSPEVATAIAYWQEYGCRQNNLSNDQCEDVVENIRKYHSMFTDPAIRLNQANFTNMSDEAFAALIYGRVIAEGRWDPLHFEPNGFSLRSPISWLNSISDAATGNTTSRIMRSLDPERPERLRGSSFGLTNIFELQGVDAARWWEYFVRYQGLHGIQGVKFTDFQGYPTDVTGDIKDSEASSLRQGIRETMAENTGSLEWYSLLVLWSSWRLYSNDLDVGSSYRNQYNLDAAYEHFQNPTYRTRNSQEISAFGVQLTVNTDVTGWMDVRGLPDEGEIEKTIQVIEGMQVNAAALGYTLEVGVDFKPYTIEEAIWLVETMNVDLDDNHMLLRRVYCQAKPNEGICREY